MPDQPPNPTALQPTVPPRRSGQTTATFAPGTPERDPADPYYIPARVGPYRVIAELGRGGMGSVLLALRDDDTLKRRVALKLVKRGLDTEDILKRFEVERRVLGALNHANIARVLDAGASEDGRPYFVMEYIEGRPIDVYCDEEQLTTLERLQLFRKVCSAVQYAHQNLIVHRDIKPGNIVVTPAGEPKLLDFGIAKLLNADLLGVSLVTRPEFRLMTPEYASPEQARGDPVTTSSDIYSLGVLLYELLTGHPPYRFASRLQEEIVRVICEVQPPSPSTAVTSPVEVRTRDGTTLTITADEIARRRETHLHTLKRGLRGDLDNIVMMAMRKVPRRRYESAEQMARDIESHLVGRPVIATKETWHYLAAKFVQRNKAGVSVAATIALLLVAGIAGTTTQLARALTAEKLAKHRYEQTRDMAKAYLEGFHDKIVRLEGATPARRLLVDTSVSVVNSLAKEAGDDPELLRVLASGYRRLADVQGGIRTGNEGSVGDALPNYTRAVVLLRRLTAGPSPERTLRLDLAETLVKQADGLERTSAAPEAAKAVEEAETIARAAVKEDPTDARARQVLTVALIARGDRDLQGGRETEAADKYRESVAILTRLVEDNPSDPSLRRELAVGYVKLGRVAEKTGNSDEALSQYHRALDIRVKLAADSPDNATNKRDLVQAYSSISEIQKNQRQFEQAAESLRLRQDLAEALAKADPGNTRAAMDVAKGYELLGELARARNDLDAARDHYDRCIALTRPIYETGREDAQKRVALAQALEKSGFTYGGLNDTATAIARYEEAVRLYEVLSYENPANKAFAKALERAKAALGMLKAGNTDSFAGSGGG